MWLQVDIQGAASKQVLKVEGQAIVPAVILDPWNLNFGDIANHSYAHHTVKMTNHGKMPIVFKAAKNVPYFWCEPPTGTVASEGDMDIMVRCGAG